MAYIKYLEWDTTHFGIKVGELQMDLPITKDELKRVRIDALQEGYDLLYLRGVTLPDSLLSDNIILADQKVVYTKIVDEVCSEIQNNPKVVSWINHDIDVQLLSLALQSGGHSRYYLDKRMPIHAFVSLYRAWIEDSLKGSIATDVLVYRDDSTIYGLLTYKQEKDIVEIGLIDVDYSMLGRGIGSSLMQSMFSRIPQGTKIEVATQKCNTAACRYYEKNGFEIRNITNIYHIWIR